MLFSYKARRPTRPTAPARPAPNTAVGIAAPAAEEEEEDLADPVALDPDAELVVAPDTRLLVRDPVVTAVAAVVFPPTTPLERAVP
ncbi:hypothetical protein Tdes44962_MAKER03058 [Teratosphaeria destructans]|uniref:Uncharacterized protein n=1 Tax=Teratosphaeria destructans TaxID=418781 RepID=A0A9W7SQW3_9PEZI|nr:hypothetical protein Tdes44962_MAKER03058 [Teratosphaeria destructans]